jgi:hypothetical protein
MTLLAACQMDANRTASQPSTSLPRQVAAAELNSIQHHRLDTGAISPESPRHRFQPSVEDRTYLVVAGLGVVETKRRQIPAMLEPTAVHLEHPGRPFGQTSSPPGSRFDPTRRLSAAPISSPWLQTTASSAAGSNSRASSVGGIDPITSAASTGRPRRRASGSTVSRQRTAGLLRIRVIR